MLEVWDTSSSSINGFTQVPYFQGNCQSMTLHTKPHASLNNSRTLPCPLTCCVLDSADCMTLYHLLYPCPCIIFPFGLLLLWVMSYGSQIRTRWQVPDHTSWVSQEAEQRNKGEVSHISLSVTTSSECEWVRPLLWAEGGRSSEMWVKFDLQTRELYKVPLLLVYIYMSNMKHGMVQGCKWIVDMCLLVCCPSVVANLPRDLHTCAGDSCSQCHSRSNAWQSWPGSDQGKHWVIMCMQLTVGVGSHCRQHNDILCELPTELSFDGQNMLSLLSWFLQLIWCIKPRKSHYESRRG